MRLGGFGEAVTEYFAEHHPEVVPAVRILAIPDAFVTHGSVPQLKHDCRIDADALRNAIAQ